MSLDHNHVVQHFIYHLKYSSKYYNFQNKNLPISLSVSLLYNSYKCYNNAFITLNSVQKSTFNMLSVFMLTTFAYLHC